MENVLSTAAQRESRKVGGTLGVAAVAYALRTLAFSEVLTFHCAHSTPATHPALMREGAAAAGRGNPNPHPHLLPRPSSPPARARGSWPAPSSLRANEPRNAALGGGGWGPGDRGGGRSHPTLQLSLQRGLLRRSRWAGDALAVRSPAGSSRRSQDAAREQAARPGLLLNRPGRRGPSPTEPLPPCPGGNEQRPGTPSSPAAPPRHPPRAAGSHAAAKVSAGWELRHLPGPPRCLGPPYPRGSSCSHLAPIWSFAAPRSPQLLAAVKFLWFGICSFFLKGSPRAASSARGWTAPLNVSSAVCGLGAPFLPHSHLLLGAWD